MSVLIKSSCVDWNGVRRLVYPDALSAATHLAEGSASFQVLEQAHENEDQLKSLQARIAELEIGLEVARRSAQTSAEDAYTQGFSAGIDEGQARSATEEHERTEKFQKGVGQAVQRLDTHLSKSGELALELTHLSLQKLFGEASYRGEAVSLMLTHQLTQIERGSILYVSVSSDDFDSVEGLRAILDGAGHERVELKLGSDLSSGQCVIDLKLGAIELDLDRQCQVLETVMAEVLGDV